MFSFGYNSAKIDCAYPVIKETVPQSALGYNTNNLYPKFPPKMSDGRSAISSWQPESAANNQLLKNNDIKSNWEYRKYLTHHSQQVMEYNFRETCNDTGYFIPPLEVGEPNKHSTNVPYTYTSYTDNSKPEGYQESDLKDMYLTREQLNSRKVAPTL
jgi:hypothetical protein